MDITDWTAIGSLIATVILLIVTGWTLRANRKMADKAETSAEASLLAARAAQESAAITAAEMELDVVADVEAEPERFGLEYVSLDERELIRLADESPDPVERRRCTQKRDRLATDRKNRVAEAEERWKNGVPRWRLHLGVTIEGASVFVHRVVLFEAPGTRISGGRVIGDRGPLPPERFWGFDPYREVDYPISFPRGYEVSFRGQSWISIPKEKVGEFLSRSGIIVEYSFGLGTEKRIARARWSKKFEEHYGKTQMDATVLSLPESLNGEEPNDVATIGNPANTAGPARRRAARALQHLATWVGGTPN